MKDNQPVPTKWPFHGVSYAEYMTLPPKTKDDLDRIVSALVLGAKSVDHDEAKAKPWQKVPHLRLVGVNG
ncbi:MAG: hypothetical protein KUL86_07010 [Castellaniella sp.]|nr:hypothetical protein [Castellaniella sp.]